MYAVEIDSVSKSFGAHKAVDRVSLRVPQGCIYGFIGPNGSGKTTTMRMIMNILLADEGRIRVLGKPLQGDATDFVGYMPEERGLYRKMKVRELLEFHGSLKNGQDLRAEATRWLEKLGLAEWSDKRVESLSKGMSQKLQFIAAVISRPRLLILDEPFTGLDPVNAVVIREAMLDLNKNGTSIILSTHDMSIAEKMCDFIFMIFGGRKVLDGTLAEIQDQYGADAIRLRMEDDGPDLEAIDGVVTVTDFGQVKELRTSGARDPQEIVQEIMRHGRVVSFEVAKPSLHDIFVRIAGPASEEARDA